MGFEQGLEPKFSKSKSWAAYYMNKQFLTISIQELDKWNTPVKWKNQVQQGKGPSTDLTGCFCQIQPSLHCQWSWADWNPPRDQGGGRWGGLHGLSGQMEEKQFPVRSRGEQRQQWLCLHSFLEPVVFLAASSTKPGQAYSNTTLGPRAEYKILKSQTDVLTITPSVSSKYTD